MNTDFQYDNFNQENINMFNYDNNNYQDRAAQRLFDPYEGFLKGNLFRDLYDQYKNYKPARLVPNNEQAELLLNVDQLTFAAHELNLYLDNFPNDRNMIELFNKYQHMANEAIMKYEKKYGPLTVNYPSNSEMFSWQAYSWPWEMEEK